MKGKYSNKQQAWRQKWELSIHVTSTKKERVGSGRCILAFRPSSVTDFFRQGFTTQTSQSMSPIGNQVFKSLRLRRMYVLQTTTPTYLNLSYMQPPTENAKM